MLQKSSTFSLALEKGAAVLFLEITDAYSVFIGFVALGSGFGDHYLQTLKYLWDYLLN